MSNSKSFNEALDALYKAARASANFVEVALTSKDTNFDSADKKRLKLALSVLKITWSSADDDDDEDDEDYEDYQDYEDDEDDEDDEYDEDYEDDEPPHTASNN